MDDAAFIVWLRNLDHARGRLGDSAITEASQQAWLKSYFDRAGDYYFIIETLDGISVTNGFDPFLRRTNLVALNSSERNHTTLSRTPLNSARIPAEQSLAMIHA